MPTPIALLVFNRPDLTSRVLDAVAAARPSRLLVAADGPRPGNERDARLCAETRALFERIDWPCTVQRRFSEHNHGCGRGVSGALDWIFSEVEEAIVLEDDCLPAPDFFPFCDAMLERYRDDPRIGIICGTNLAETKLADRNSWVFSRYPVIWGWASWRRHWVNYYDFTMALLPEIRESRALDSIFDDPGVALAWLKVFENCYNGGVDTWDWQMIYAGLTQGLLNVVPGTNLITNLGFRPDATHTKLASALADRATGGLRFPLRPPSLPLRSRVVDDYLEEVFYKVKEPVAPVAETSLAGLCLDAALSAAQALRQGETVKARAVGTGLPTAAAAVIFGLTAATEAAALIDTGRWHEEAGQLLPALICFQIARDLRPGVAEPCCRLAHVLLQLKEFDLAEQLCRTVLEFGGEDFWALCLLASVMSKRMRRVETLKFCRHAMALEPQHTWPRLIAASVLESEGRFAEATAQCRIALAVDPGNHWALVLLGTVLRLAHRWEEALEIYQAATRRYPQDRGLAEGLAETQVFLGLAPGSGPRL